MELIVDKSEDEVLEVGDTFSLDWIVKGYVLLAFKVNVTKLTRLYFACSLFIVSNTI